MSSGSIPDLVIPVRFDVSKIPGQLKQVQQSGTAASQAVGKGFTKAKESADGLGSSLISMMRAQMGLSALQNVASGIAGSFRDTSQYVMQTAKDFQDLRATMQQVAALTGKLNTNVFTVDQARKAAATGLTPAEFRTGQEQFLNLVGAQVGDQKGAKLTTEQAEDCSSRIAVMMKTGGFAPAAGMNLGGAILQQKTGPQNVDKLMQEFSVAFQVMEKGQVDIARAAPEVAELMAMGVKTVEAAKLFSVVSPAAPGQEGTSTQAALRAIEDLRISGKAGEFGIGEDMTPYEAAKAFGTNLAARRADLLKGGMGEEKAKISLAALLKQKGVAADIRERRGLVAGVGRMGTELGGFEMFEQVAAGTSPQFEAQRRAAYEKSEQGVQAKLTAEQALADAEAGARGDMLKKVRDRARLELTKAGRFEQVPLEQRIKAGIPTFGIGDKLDEQQINMQSIQGMRARLGEGVSTADKLIAINTAATNNLLRELIARYEANKPKDPVLAAPPAGGNGARMGN